MYSVVAVLFKAGDQTPVIPFVEVVGNDKVAPEQMGSTCVKVGATRVPQSHAPTSLPSDPKAIGVASPAAASLNLTLPLVSS